jgi:hypothetical protein
MLAPTPVKKQSSASPGTILCGLLQKIENLDRVIINEDLENCTSLRQGILTANGAPLQEF